MVSILVWLTVVECLCRLWPWLCSVRRVRVSSLGLSSFLTCHIFIKSNTTGATSGAETAYP